MSGPDALRLFLDATRPSGCARLNDATPDADSVSVGHDGTLRGYAQSSEGTSGYTVDCVTSDATLRDQLVTKLIATIPEDVDATWWGHEVASDAALADKLHMRPPHRRLLNMRRPLPLEPELAAASDELSTRQFVVGQDEDAWLTVNHAAFSWHTEQGDWDLATLRTRINEPWFDPAGFLLHERDGRLGGFCWAKRHQQRIGEIFVIAVHPDFHGLGLGRALTVAGLRWLTSIGSNVGMLYVEADNAAAVHLYEDLGFQTAHVDVAYHRPARKPPAPIGAGVFSLKSKTGDNR